MAITFVQYAEAETGAGTSITLNVPAGAAAGDLLIAVIQTNGTRVTASSMNFSPGAALWELVQFVDYGFHFTRVYWRVMKSGDTSWAFTTTASAVIQGLVLAYNESGTANWVMTNPPGTLTDSNALTATSEVGFVENGVLFYVGQAYKSGGTITGISLDQGTSRRNYINAASTSAIAWADTITTGEQRTAVTSTVTTASGNPTDHVAFTFYAQSAATVEMYDPAELIDGAQSRTVQVYKGRDTAAADTVGAA
jgi:hypothetical protein